MARNGSGTYNLPAGNPVTTGTTISSTWANSTLSDMATALTGSVAADGQTTPSANLPMGGFAHTNVGNATVRTMYPSAGQVQDGVITNLTSVAGTNTITAVSALGMTAYATGQKFTFVSAGANTGAATININSIGAKAITKNGTTALIAGDIASGAAIEVFYDGTQFQLISGISSLSTPVSIANGGTNNGSLSVAAGGVVYTDGSKQVNTGAGTSGQVLTSAGASAPTWSTLTTATVQTYDTGTAATWTKPTAATLVRIQLWGGGGSGGCAGLSTSSAGGGGGGAYTEFTVKLSDLGTVTYTVGAGGAAIGGGAANGNAGGDTSVTITNYMGTGTTKVIYAWGGGRGMSSTGGAVGGGGGGTFSVAGVSDGLGGSPLGGTSGTTNIPANANNSTFGGGGGGTGSATAASVGGGGFSVYGGGGGGGGLDSASGSGVGTGGQSVYGGGGGGGSSQSGPAGSLGASYYGGNGGAGGSGATNAVNGTAPAGGGGGACTGTSGAGAAGRVQFSYW